MSVFHLKYRPIKFADLDLADVAQKLQKFLSQKEIPQSFLLSGPKGAGKTSVARIISKAVNCLDIEKGEPCDKCENCKEIQKGGSMDIIEIDAASNRGIEDVRNFKESAYLMPSKLSKKVFIIDEVHMLTKEAFNALLKVIEEPPAHVMFILCTTDEEKIPETVLSRLVKVEFRKGIKNELIKSLDRIIEGEKIVIEDKAKDLIVEKSDGSFRNLQKCLNEIVLEYGQNISLENVAEYFSNRVGDYSGSEIEMDLKNGEAKVILEKLEKMAIKGINFVSLRENWLQYFHKKMLENTSDQNLVRWVNLLLVASKQEKDVFIEQLPLQLAVIEYLKDKTAVTIEVKDVEVVVQNEEIMIEETEIGGVVELQHIEEKWGNILYEIKPFNHSVEAFLRATRPKKIRGNVLYLEVFYPFHKDKLDEVKNKQLVERCLSKVMGQTMGLEFCLSKDRKKPLIIKNDTPVEKVVEGSDIYDVAKNIFG